MVVETASSHTCKQVSDTRLFWGQTLLIAGLIFRPASANGQELPTLGVCELLNNVKAWSGKLIAVTGNLASSMEIFAVYERCPQELIIEGRKWASSIDLRVKGSADGEALADLRSIDFIGGIARVVRETYTESKDGYQASPIQISATFVGYLRTLRSYGIREGPGGTRVVTPGFGHMGAAPAQLELIAVRDIAITGLNSTSSTSRESPGVKK